MREGRGMCTCCFVHLYIAKLIDFSRLLLRVVIPSSQIKGNFEDVALMDPDGNPAHQQTLVEQSSKAKSVCRQKGVVSKKGFVQLFQTCL